MSEIQDRIQDIIKRQEQEIEYLASLYENETTENNNDNYSPVLCF